MRSDQMCHLRKNKKNKKTRCNISFKKWAELTKLITKLWNHKLDDFDGIFVWRKLTGLEWLCLIGKQLGKQLLRHSSYSAVENSILSNLTIQILQCVYSIHNVLCSPIHVSFFVTKQDDSPYTWSYRRDPKEIVMTSHIYFHFRFSPSR